MSDQTTTIGRYKVVSRLGQGGLSTLYLAHDPAIDRMVAIKVMRGELEDSDLRARFAREARAAGSLRHPNIVTIFDVGEEAGSPYIAMEYIRGETLKAIIQRRAALSLPVKLKLLEELCDGLSYAHKAGLVHRDIKPANLMLDGDGAVKILDFGIVRTSSSGMTQTGVLVGTLAYMSPEQIAGKAIDHRSDIFSVGNVAYELISYKPAFPGTLQDGILGRVMHEAPAPLAHAVPDLDPEIIAIVDRALEKDPANRYQDLRDMRHDLIRVRRRLTGDDEVPQSLESPEVRAPVASTPAERESRARVEHRRRLAIVEHLAAAQRALAGGDFEAAVAAAELALIIDPDDASALDLITKARVATDDQEVARWLNEARDHLQRGDLVSAAELVERARVLQPSLPAVAALAREIEDARHALEQRHDREQRVAEAIARARAALASGATELAMRAVDEAAARDPHHAEALRLKQEILEKIADQASRERHLGQDAIEHAVALARQLLADGALQSCLTTIDEGLAIEATNVTLKELKARAHERLAQSQPPVEPVVPADVTVIAPRAVVKEPPPAPPEAEEEGTAFFPLPGDAEPDQLPDVQLVISGGNPLNVGRTFKIANRTFTIGRSAGDLTLSDPSWSRQHVAVEYTDAGFVARDLGSSNGTFVNGRRISGPEPLFFGATIQVGQTVFTFKSGTDTSLPDLTDCVVADRYLLKTLLRDSAKGAVYLARHRHTGGEVAIKLLSPELLRYSGYREQFHREAEMAAELRHPHICRVMDYGPVELRPRGRAQISTQFLCLEFMAGGTLAERLEPKAPVSTADVARWIDILADALQYAHRHNVIHGNLKPTSVVFDTEANVYLTDFAIAQRISNGEGKPVMGTAAYMAPEQWSTEAVTTAIDQFALAALAYYMTTGSRPFAGQDHPEVREQNFRRGPIPAHEEAAQNGRQLPAAVSRVLQRGLAPSPSQRYASVAEFGKALVSALTGIRSSTGAPQIFLSYQREGASGWAQYFGRELKEKHGLSVFVDVERRDGAGQFPTRLARAIEECDVFVVLLGASTLESKWVREEIKLAYQHGRPMVPVFQESWVAPEVQRGSDPPLEALMSYDGVHLLDRRNIHVDHTVADLARLVRGSGSGKDE
jgi:serine/threonine protein kinase